MKKKTNIYSLGDLSPITEILSKFNLVSIVVDIMLFAMVLNSHFLAAYFVAGPDIGKFTIKAAEDIRTVNKNVHFRPTCNFLNINELASLWEKKIGRTLPRVLVSEDDLLAAAEGIQSNPILFNLIIFE